LNMKNIGIIGLGIMGGAMARELLKAGYVVAGLDVVPAANARLKKMGGIVAKSATELANMSDVVIVSLSTSFALQETTKGLALSVRREKGNGLIVIETSTLPVADKETMQATLKRAGISVLDCPISGTAVRLKDRAWTIYSSGPKKAFAKIKPLLQVFTDNLPYVGVYGNGTKMKFAANRV
jgi:L-threonate 2-dehydrogenase